MALALGDGRLAWWAPERSREAVDVAALVEAHAALLYRVAFSVVRSPAEAEDIVQESFLRAVEQGGKLGEVKELRAWLVRVAWNLALDRKRRTQPAQMEDDAAELIASAELPADRRVIAAAELQRVLMVVDTLPKHERAVLLLSAVEELSAGEIAVVLGRSASSVRSLVFRARAHLEERLARSTPEPRDARGRMQ